MKKRHRDDVKFTGGFDFSVVPQGDVYNLVLVFFFLSFFHFMSDDFSSFAFPGHPHSPRLCGKSISSRQ